jgi:hypothetical protein
MTSYYYRGRRYTRKPTLKVKLKRVASRVWESMQGDHPAGGEALVERMIREYPGRPTKPEASKPDAPKTERPEQPAPSPNKSDDYKETDHGNVHSHPAATSDRDGEAT